MFIAIGIYAVVALVATAGVFGGMRAGANRPGTAERAREDHETMLALSRKRRKP